MIGRRRPGPRPPGFLVKRLQDGLWAPRPWPARVARVSLPLLAREKPSAVGKAAGARDASFRSFYGASCQLWVCGECCPKASHTPPQGPRIIVRPGSGAVAGPRWARGGADPAEPSPRCAVSSGGPGAAPAPRLHRPHGPRVPSCLSPLSHLSPWAPLTRGSPREARTGSPEFNTQNPALKTQLGASVLRRRHRKSETESPAGGPSVCISAQVFKSRPQDPLSIP